MNKFLLPVIMGAALLFSCTSPPARMILNLPAIPEETVAPREYIILDYKNKAGGEAIPQWVNLWLDLGVHGVEALNAYNDRFAFVKRNEGNSFSALTLWKNNFLLEMDFPRMAASRIEARFSTAVAYPDEEYGDFFHILIRAASDASWTGAFIEDDFWLLKKYLPSDDEPERENWEYIILVSMRKTDFTSQLDEIFQRVNPDSPPTEAQIAATNHVKEHFFEGF